MRPGDRESVAIHITSLGLEALPLLELSGGFARRYQQEMKGIKHSALQHPL